MEQAKIRKWNLIGYIISIMVTMSLIGLIIYGNEHKVQLKVVMYALTVILIVAVFAIIRRNIKTMCNNKLNHKS